MKRRFIPGLMLAAALTLTNCSEQLVSPEKENDIIIDETVQTPSEGERIPYEIFVNDPVTKTISDGTSTYWVDLATAEKNGLGQDAVDRVSLFSKPSDGAEYTNHGVYTYVGSKKFIGELAQELEGSNNWYCIYPYNSGNTATSEINAKVVIGADEQSGYTQVQAVADSKAHIAGINYPMYGTSTTTSSEEAPIFASMNQMSALVALKIKNDAWGDIVVTNAALQASTPIVGEFEVNVAANSLSYEATSSTSNVAKLNLSNAITIPQGGDATLYLAVKPFTAAANQSLTVIVNNSIRTIAKLPSSISFEAGTITTLTVPVKPLEHTIETDGSEFLSTKVNCTTVTATINGRKINDMIVIGSEDKPGSVTIKGNLGDVLNSLPLGFYASSWNGKQSVLIVEAVEATINISIFDKKLDVSAAFTREELAKLINRSPEFLAIQPYPVGTFNESNTGHNLIVLDEEPLHKSVDEAKGNTFLTSYGITIQDIKEAIYGNNDNGQQKKLVELLKKNSDKIVSLVDKINSNLPALDPDADDYDEQLKEREESVNALICVGMSVANCLVTLRTADIGEEGATDPRVVMWGLDITTEEEREAANN